jgi:hypothetical protein
MHSMLPKGITEKDLKYPERHDFPENFQYEDRSFELWFCGSFGWCIPTLQIRGAGRRMGVAPRTYAVSVDTKKVCRIGLGPHVLKRVTVYVRKSRLEVLKPFLDLRREGAIAANNVRDRISTRRAQSAMRRGDFMDNLLGGL